MAAVKTIHRGDIAVLRNQSLAELLNGESFVLQRLTQPWRPILRDRRKSPRVTSCQAALVARRHGGDLDDDSRGLELSPAFGDRGIAHAWIDVLATVHALEAPAGVARLEDDHLRANHVDERRRGRQLASREA